MRHSLGKRKSQPINSKNQRYRELQEIKSDLHEVLEELASGDDGEAQDAAVTLVMRMKSCGAGAAVPAALVAQNAVPALEELARKLPHKEHVQQLLRLCHVARDAVRTPDMRPCQSHSGSWVR